MGAPREPAVVVDTGRGHRLIAPCPPDRRRLEVTVRQLSLGFAPGLLDTCTWTYDPAEDTP
jgi:hypothetical protein